MESKEIQEAIASLVEISSVVKLIFTIDPEYLINSLPTKQHDSHDHSSQPDCRPSFRQTARARPMAPCSGNRWYVYAKVPKC